MADGFLAAANATWDWAESRQVRVDFWRDDFCCWEVMLHFRDGRGRFCKSVPLLIPRFGERMSKTEVLGKYLPRLHHLLDQTCAQARAARIEEFKGS